MAPLLSEHSEARTVNSSYRINLRKLNTLLFFLLIAGAATYFMTTNRLSTTGFVFKEMKQRSNELDAENSRLESRMSELASYQNLNPQIKSLGLVTTSDIAYINWDNQIVARK